LQLYRSLSESHRGGTWRASGGPCRRPLWSATPRRMAAIAAQRLRPRRDTTLRRRF
jgi:hypothetical protein